MTELNQELPTDVTLQACNSAGKYTIPKGVACKIEYYRGNRNMIVFYINLDVLKAVHPYGYSASFFFGAENPTGRIIERKMMDWREDSPTRWTNIDNPEFLALEQAISCES